MVSTTGWQAIKHEHRQKSSRTFPRNRNPVCILLGSVKGHGNSKLPWSKCEIRVGWGGLSELTCLLHHLWRRAAKQREKNKNFTQMQHKGYKLYTASHNTFICIIVNCYQIFMMICEIKIYPNTFLTNFLHSAGCSCNFSRNSSW